MFEAIPMKRPHFFLRMVGRKNLGAQKVGVQIRGDRPPPGSEIQLVDGAIGKIASVVHHDVDLAQIPALEGYRAPGFFLRDIEPKAVCGGTDPAYGLVRHGQIRRDHRRASFRQLQRDRLSDALGGARHQSHVPFVCSRWHGANGIIHGR